MCVAYLRTTAELSLNRERYDAISLTYNPDGFTPMNGWLSQFGIDRQHFYSDVIRKAHNERGFRVISHGDDKPIVITASKTQCWESEPFATAEILHTADCERTKKLCMLHFGSILGKFPFVAFRDCIRSVRQAKYWARIKEIDIYVPEEHQIVANAIWAEEIKY